MKSRIFFTMLFLLCLTSCNILGSSSDAEVELLSDQVAALSTQNALLMEKMEEDASESTIEEESSPIPTEEPTPFVIPSATPESLPTEPVMAGTPIIYDGWSIMVSQNFSVTNKGLIYLTIFVRNLSENDRTFRFTNNSIQLSDNLNNHYPNDSNYEKCLYDVKNLTVRGQDQVKMESLIAIGTCTSQGYFTTFEGPIPLETGHLIVHLDNFGPFTDIEVIIEL